MAPRIPLCCFVSDGSIVTIKIDPAAHVEQLRDAIFFKQAFNYLGRFPSSAMSLYLVQTSFGTWMTEIDHELKKMFKDGFCSGCKELRPTWHVQDYFKPDDSTPANAIHVLVILPPNVIVPREEFQAAMMKARAEAASIATEKAEQAKYRKQKRAKRVVLKNKHKKPRRWTKSTHFRIWCSVFEAGGVFSIKVCHDEGYFGPLRKVFRKQMYERIYGFRGYTMSLYLAQKANGEWLRDDLKLDAFIRNEDPDNYDDLDIRIPNGNGINGVEALGHANPNGGGTLNLFGRAFDAAGFQWTTEFCQTDSDGDGATNGEELGDPCCQWTQGTRLQASSAVTHPGVANPFTNDQLASLKCQELSTPPETPEPVAPAPSPVSDADDPSNAPSPQSVLPPLLPSGAPVTPPTPASPMTPSPVQSKKPAKVEKVDTSDAHRTSRFTMALVVGLCSVLFAM
ncbi:hypothetical protein Poli38472_004553 [Pythium oligandrum]|uniref:Uncharacterized protein n=1 Tax=Pythium oligandrum TaxID=41045 RepID=A0A8K1CA14_PYTOL|nr:hypothetical protein Poli38472_004553 [Pythium oligandrum]|eukprot:TMW59484.1 hypothetical protein Poli38472_004553 [Pythium oligandrum]